MARLYANENFPLPAVEALRQRGHDVLTAHESGRANQAIPDHEVLAFATQQERVLITFNRKHFIRLHNENPGHAGVIVCTVDVDFEALAERIHAALEAHETFVGQLARVNRPARESP